MNTAHPSQSPDCAPVGAGAGAVRVPDRWRWYYNVLQRLRDRLLEERDGELEAARESLEPHRQDAADTATDEFDHDLALAFLSQHQEAVEEIGAAMSRIIDGTYGVCEESGQTIPGARLRAVPWTRHTLEVAERLEREGRVLPTRLPRASSLQGPLPGGLAQAADPENEYAQAQFLELLQRRTATRAVEQGNGQEEAEAEAPAAAESGEAPS